MSYVPYKRSLVKLGNEYYSYYATQDGKILDIYGNELHQTRTIKPGYPTVRINNSNKYVHRLVAFVFVHNSNPDKCKIINHIDGDKENNHYTNLEWTTHRGNLHHAKNNGLMIPFVLTEELAHEICQRIVLGHGETKIARDLNVTYGSVHAIRNRDNSWLYVSNQYIFPPRKSRTTIEISEQIYTLLKEKYSVKYICNKLNVTKDVVKERQWKLNKNLYK